MAQIPMLPMADPARSSQRLRDAPCEARAQQGADAGDDVAERRGCQAIGEIVQM
jgi:hypothetical protein